MREIFQRHSTTEGSLTWAREFNIDIIGISEVSVFKSKKQVTIESKEEEEKEIKLVKRKT